GPHPGATGGDHCGLRRDGTGTDACARRGSAGLRHAVGGVGPRRRPPCAPRRQRDTARGAVRGGPLFPARDERRAPGCRRGSAATGARGVAEHGMKKLVAAGGFIVALVEGVAVAVLDRELVLLVVGGMVALVLLYLRLYLSREPGYESGGAAANDAAESLRRWLSRTETLVSRADATRRDWDRHLRPMLARQFELATG